MTPALAIVICGYVFMRCIEVLCNAGTRYSNAGRIVAIGSAIALALITAWELGVILNAPGFPAM